MKIKCSYCDSYINDTCENCPNCGAVNDHMQRAVSGTPKTIAELDAWYKARKLPSSEVTRFFIGVNYTGRRAFGIYEEQGEFIVYKNKDDGTRAIRYRGTDEAYAVNELYLKLKSEILNQKAANISSGRVPRKKESFGKRLKRRLTTIGVVFGSMLGLGAMAIYPIIGKIIISLIITLVLSVIVWAIMASAHEKKKGKEPSKKLGFLMLFVSIAIFAGVFAIAVNINRVRYYQYEDDIYCTYHGNYYLYDSYYEDYSYVEDAFIPAMLVSSPDLYYWEEGNSIWGTSDTITAFEDSGYYDEYIDVSPDSDSDYDWDSGSSWDSGGTDWGSDW